MKKIISLLLILTLTISTSIIVTANNAPYSVSYLQNIDDAEYVKYKKMDDTDIEGVKMLQRSLEMYDVLPLYLKNSNWSSIVKPFRDAFLLAGFNEKTNSLKTGDIQYIYSKDINSSDSEVFIILGEKESQAIINESGLVYIEHALLQFDFEDTTNREISEDKSSANSENTLLVHSVNGTINLQLNGKDIYFDVPPQIINERTMVPLRAIFEALGATVDWNSNTQTATSTKDKTTIVMTINSPAMYVNGTAVTLDSPACLVSGRTLVPVRAISEAFDIKVEWKETVIENEVIMYALDGRTQVVPQSQVEANKAVGWYTEPVTIMYALDGRTQIVAQSQVEANKAVGWYTEPMTTMYALDGRTQIVPQSQVEANKAVGWYESLDEVNKAKKMSDPKYAQIREVLDKCNRYVSYLYFEGATLETAVELYQMTKKTTYLVDIVENVTDISDYFNKIKGYCEDIHELYPLYLDVNSDIPIITSSNTYKAKTLATKAMRVKVSYNALCDIYGGNKIE